MGLPFLRYMRYTVGATGPQGLQPRDDSRTRGGAAMTFDELLRDDLLAAPGGGGAGASITKFRYERGR